MARYIILAFTNPVAGRENEYNKWYDTVAVPAYRRIPGMTHMGRYRLADVPKLFDFARNSEWQYLSVYTFETDDYETYARDAIATLSAIENYSFCEAIDKTTFFEPTYIEA